MWKVSSVSAETVNSRFKQVNEIEQIMIGIKDGIVAK